MPIKASRIRMDMLVILLILPCLAHAKCSRNTQQRTLLRLGSFQSLEDCSTKLTTHASTFQQDQCDDIKPENSYFGCDWIASKGFCEYLQEYECNKSCGKCPNCDGASPDVSCSAVYDSNTSKVPVPTEAEALLKFKSQLSGDWITELQTWTEETDVCGWEYIQCQNGQVKRVDISGINLQGSLVPELSVLTDLTEFWATFNQLQGSLPPEFSAWSNMYWIDLGINQITGKLPVEYSNWRLLEYIGVHNNLLTGQLPEQFSVWESMKVFYAEVNKFTGELPIEYSIWTTADTLIFKDNYLSGVVPAEYSLMASAYSQFFPQDGSLCVNQENVEALDLEDYDDEIEEAWC
eukprot:TRINITY_DN32819_c0_g1_i1.p1 TRINITY_DN32819_c0_g1~~TRINITY_DN32819_c0_g1_i1.p1  ORF type:complete len:349 (-),score=25.99 TRINITY_DN32819_c0_g1_i1:457-1503(-)